MNAGHSVIPIRNARCPALQAIEGPSNWTPGCTPNPGRISRVRVLENNRWPKFLCKKLEGVCAFTTSAFRPLVGVGTRGEEVQVVTAEYENAFASRLHEMTCKVRCMNQRVLLRSQRVAFPRHSNSFSRRDFEQEDKLSVGVPWGFASIKVETNCDDVYDSSCSLKHILGDDHFQELLSGTDQPPQVLLPTLPPYPSLPSSRPRSGDEAPRCE